MPGHFHGSFGSLAIAPIPPHNRGQTRQRSSNIARPKTLPQSLATISSPPTLKGTHHNRRAALLAATNPPQQGQPTAQPGPLKPQIFFDTRLPTPYVYEVQNNRQIVCPDCSLAQITRYCNGATEQTSTLCPKHIHLDSQTQSKGEQQYDQAELEHIRSLLHGGDLQPPADLFCTDDPNTFTRAEMRRLADQRALEHFIPGCTPNKQDYFGTPMGFTRDGDGEMLKRVWPVQPRCKYEHARGCVFSEEPDYVLGTAAEVREFREFMAVKYRNEFEERYLWCAGCLKGLKRGWKCESCAAVVWGLFEMACAPAWAIGVFLRRCNGMYFNALGYVKAQTGRRGRLGEGGVPSGEEMEGDRKEDDFIHGMEFSARTLQAKELSLSKGLITEEEFVEDSWRRWNVMRKEKARRRMEGDWKGMDKARTGADDGPEHEVTREGADQESMWLRLL